MSRQTWDTLSKDDQALITKFGREAQVEERVLWDEYEKEALDKAKAAGIEIIDDRRQEAVPGRGEAGVGQVRAKYAAMIKRIQDVK